MAHGEPSTKKFKHSIISERIFKPEFQKIFRRHWHGGTAFKNDDMEIIAEPFRVCKIPKFLKDEKFMEDLKSELADVKSRRNSIDLFQFEQTVDLSNVKRINVETFYRTFQTNLKDWMEQNTAIDLNGTISMSGSCYSDTDYLLCHDDNMGDRRIAFILYLSDDWVEEYGGALDLFDTDEHGQPWNVVKSIIPEFNSLVMFEVVNNSYHQVAEVVSADKARWSINGWFHGPIVESVKVERPVTVINYLNAEHTRVNLSQWVSNNYLYAGIVKDIQEDVEQESFTFLSKFLKQNVYDKLSEEIKSEDIKWERVGPADVRNYEVADEDSLPKMLADFCRIFKSMTIFQLLQNYTGLDLVPETESGEPRVTIELQRWSRGCYTLIHGEYNNEDNNEVNNEVNNDDNNDDDNDDDNDDNKKDNNEDNNEDAVASSDKSTLGNTSKYGYEAAVSVEGESSPSRLQNNYSEEYEASERSAMPPGSQGDDEQSEDKSTLATTSRCAGVEGKSSSVRRTKLTILQRKYVEESGTSEKSVTSPGSQGDDEQSEDKNTLATTSRCAGVDGGSPCWQRTRLSRLQRKYSEEYGPNETNLTPPGSQGDDEQSEEEDAAPRRRRSKRRTPRTRRCAAASDKDESPSEVESPPKIECLVDVERQRKIRETDDDPDVSDIGDYLSDHGDTESECSDKQDSKADEASAAAVPAPEPVPPALPGALDAIMQFNIGESEKVGIDYVDPLEKDASLIYVPPRENHLCLVFREEGICRLHKYVNHYITGYFYNLVCTYLE